MMKRLILIAAASLGLSATAQMFGDDVKVVGVGSAPSQSSSAVSVKKTPAVSGVCEYDRKTGMMIADGEYECLYDYTINNPAKGDTVRESTSCVLQIGGGIGRFSDYTTFCADSANHQVNKDEDAVKSFIKRELSNSYCFEEIVYQNYPSGKMTVYGILAPNYFVYEENMNPFEWELTEETDTVCGYECVKATGLYGGRKWEVWFTPEIPVAMGPWKFCGLPGLIMKAKDRDNLHNFEAISFRKGEMPLYKPMWPDAVKTERSKFIKQKNESPNPMNSIPQEAIREISVYKAQAGGVIAINGVPIRERANGYVPRELE